MNLAKDSLKYVIIVVVFTIFIFGCYKSKIRSSTVTEPDLMAQKITNELGIEFVLIKPGQFIMGRPLNPPNRSQHHDNLHRVIFTKSFYMMTTEVSQEQWEKVTGNNPSFFIGKNLPVESVTFDDVQKFIKKLNQQDSKYQYDLPTSSQWEYAYRASFTRNSLRDIDDKNNNSWYMRIGLNSTLPVDSGKPNEWGLFNMAGNVREWCSDWYKSYIYRKFWEVTDPTGPNDPMNNCTFADKKLCVSKVIRGCCWDINNVITHEKETTLCPPYIRGFGLLDTMSDTLGFRLIIISKNTSI